ncbi:hypothetical protein ACWDO0_22225 [Nocardia rhamnosiphila]
MSRIALLNSRRMSRIALLNDLRMSRITLPNSLRMSRIALPGSRRISRFARGRSGRFLRLPDLGTENLRERGSHVRTGDICLRRRCHLKRGSRNLWR